MYTYSYINSKGSALIVLHLNGWMNRKAFDIRRKWKAVTRSCHVKFTRKKRNRDYIIMANDVTASL